MKKLHMWLLVFLLSAPLAAWAGESKVDQLRVESAFSQTATGQTQGTNDAYVKGQLEVDGAVQLDGGLTIQALTATATVTVKHGLLTLNHISTPIVATIAAPTAATYLTIHNLSASGNVAHTVKLTSGTWDGTNNTATFNFTTAAGQTLTVVGVSATRYVIISNVGTVALSST